MEQNQWQEYEAIMQSIGALKPLEIAIKWGSPVYTFNDKNVFSYKGFKHHFAVWFYNGAQLKDDLNVLIAATEGKTKNLRQWRFDKDKPIDKNNMLRYIDEAIALEQAGVKLIIVDKKELAVPQILQHEFSSDSEFQIAFERLSQGKRNEYIDHITSAKQLKTQMDRLAKIKPSVMEGKSLYDKYKKYK